LHYHIRELRGTACKTPHLVLHVGAVLEQSTKGLRSEDAGHVCLETVGTVKFLRLVGHIDLVRYNSPVEPVHELLSTSTVTLGSKKGIDLCPPLDVKKRPSKLAICNASNNSQLATCNQIQ